METIANFALVSQVSEVNDTLLFVKEQIENLKDAVVEVASEDVSSLPESERTMYLRSKFQTQINRLFQHSNQ